MYSYLFLILEEYMSFYDDNAESYFNLTSNFPAGDLQRKMLDKLSPGDCLLDVGCGSGRDAAYFIDKGLTVTAFDASENLVRLANERFQINAKVCSYLSFHSSQKYKAFWALASLVHLSEAEFALTVKHLSQYLEAGGLFYLSLKPESEHGVDQKKGLFFQGWSEVSFNKLFLSEFVDIFELAYKIDRTDDVGGRNFKWLDVWLVKK